MTGSPSSHGFWGVRNLAKHWRSLAKDEMKLKKKQLLHSRVPFEQLKPGQLQRRIQGQGHRPENGFAFHGALAAYLRGGQKENC